MIELHKTEHNLFFLTKDNNVIRLNHNVLFEDLSSLMESVQKVQKVQNDLELDKQFMIKGAIQDKYKTLDDLIMCNAEYFV